MGRRVWTIDDLTGLASWAEAPDEPTTFEFTAAQIKAMHTTPLRLVGAPGAGKIAVPSKIESILVYGSATYSLNGAPYIGWSGSLISSLGALGDVLVATETAFGVDQLASLDTVAADAENAALTISASGNPTTGDSTLKVIVTYAVLSLT